MIFRKIVVTAAIACLVLAFTACGDDDSSSFVSPEKETSSSIAESSSERSGGDPSSPSFFCKIQPVHRLQEQLFCKVKQLGDVIFEYADSLF